MRRISVLRSGRTRGVLATLAAVAVAAGTLGVTVMTPAGAMTSGQALAPSGACEREKPLVRRALDRSALRVDVSGDGRLDKVAVVTDWRAAKRCRAFVGVHVRGGASYSAPLQGPTVPPKGVRAEIVGLPDLGNDRGAEIVVDTHVKADSTVAQMFTLTEDGLRFMSMPAFEDGTFVVEGGGVSFPRGAGCTSTGRLRLSMATLLDNGRYQVTRHGYGVRGDKGRLTGPRMKVATVSGNRLAAVFPEFVRPHWKACTGTVRR